MGKFVKRVPLNFAYPKGVPWVGYIIEPNYCVREHNYKLDYFYTQDEACATCRAYAKLKGIPDNESGCPNFKGYYAPKFPRNFSATEGEGWQLWEAEGGLVMPVSDVFATEAELKAATETNEVSLKS